MHTSHPSQVPPLVVDGVSSARGSCHVGVPTISEHYNTPPAISTWRRKTLPWHVIFVAKADLSQSSDALSSEGDHNSKPSKTCYFARFLRHVLSYRQSLYDIHSTRLNGLQLLPMFHSRARGEGIHYRALRQDNLCVWKLPRSIGRSSRSFETMSAIHHPGVQNTSVNPAFIFILPGR